MSPWRRAPRRGACHQTAAPSAPPRGRWCSRAGRCERGGRPAPRARSDRRRARRARRRAPAPPRARRWSIWSGGRAGCASASGLQHEADAAHGVQDARLTGGLELAPEVADEHVGDVGPGVERVAPDLLVQLAAREDLPGATHEEREQLELPPRQLEIPAGALRAGGGGVDDEVTRLEPSGGRGWTTA